MTQKIDCDLKLIVSGNFNPQINLQFYESNHKTNKTVRKKTLLKTSIRIYMIGFYLIFWYQANVNTWFLKPVN